MDLKTYLDRPDSMSMAELARAIGKHPDQVRQWRDGTDGRRPSPACAAAIELATAGLVTCEVLRPDLQWARIKDKAWPHHKGRPANDVAAHVAAQVAG